MFTIIVFIVLSKNIRRKSVKMKEVHNERKIDERKNSMQRKKSLNNSLILHANFKAYELKKGIRKTFKKH